MYATFSHQAKTAIQDILLCNTGVAVLHPDFVGFRHALSNRLLKLPGSLQIDTRWYPVVTDGSCTNPHHALIGKATCGIFWGPRLCPVADVLPGRDHTSPRAELWAVTLGIHHSANDLQIYSDCQYAVDVANLLLKDSSADIPPKWHLLKLSCL